MRPLKQLSSSFTFEDDVDIYRIFNWKFEMQTTTKINQIEASNISESSLLLFVLALPRDTPGVEQMKAF